MPYDCLIVDDELTIAQSTCEYFNLLSVHSAYVCSYEECIAFMKKEEVSLLLLDINLGERSGFLLCKELRESYSQPILFISARTDDDDILTALQIGGDDYIKKPYTLSILLAKVKAVLKRCAPLKPDIINFSHLTIDTSSHRVTVHQKAVHLKDMEYRLLLYFIQNQNRIVSKEELLENVWQNSFVGEGTLSVHVRHLREKLETDPNNPQLIKTIWGTGYLMENA